jgi:hypothetical protein
MAMKKIDNWVPEIMYEDDGTGMSSHIPFIPVPKEEQMPKLLYVFESRETGEFEPGPEGEDLPVTEMELHQYADMSALKSKLTDLQYDFVRQALGLEPMVVAATKGVSITNSIRAALNAET